MLLSMGWLPLCEPTASSEWSSNHLASNALDEENMETVLCTGPDDRSPWFTADFPVGDAGDPSTLTPIEGAVVTCIDVFGDLRPPGDETKSASCDYSHNLEGIFVTLRDRSGRNLWTSPHATAQLGAPSLAFHIPNYLWADSFSVERHSSEKARHCMLTSSFIRAYGARPSKVVLLCQHGQATHDTDAEYDATTGPALTLAGQKHAHGLPSKLKGVPAPEVIICSPQLRTLETAFLMREASDVVKRLPFEIDSEAYEVGFYDKGCEVPGCSAFNDRFLEDPALQLVVAAAAPKATWIPQETQKVAGERAARLLERLKARPERVLLLVAPAGIILELRGALDPLQRIPGAAQSMGSFAQGVSDIVPLVVE